MSWTAGLRYQFDLEGAATAEGTLADSVLELRDASGSNARLTYLATSSGTMFLAARSADATTGSYKLGAVRKTETQTSLPQNTGAKRSGTSQRR